MLIRCSGIYIPNYHSEYDEIVKNLTRNVIDWNDETRCMKLYMDINNGIIIPRWYPVKDRVVDNSNTGQIISISSNIILKNERQKLSFEFYLENRTGILQLEPGSGKTVISIHAICNISRKVIILTHKLSLVKQWKSEILKFTNATELDIGILSTSNYNKEFNKPIIISTVQTIISGLKHKLFVDKLYNCGLGVAIFDECHTTIGPEVFSKVSMSLNCYRVYGLSATPRRFDNSDILGYHLGKISYFKAADGELLHPKIFMIYFPFGVYNKSEKYIMWGGKFQYSRYEKQMFKSESYLLTISKMIRNAFLNKRVVLVLGKNINTLIHIALKTGIEKEYIGAFIPTATKDEILSISDTLDLNEAFHNKQVVFSTYLACRDGNNRKDLDCLFLTVPTSNIEQAVGRILRPNDGKPQPIVIDFVDTEGPKVWSLYDELHTDKTKRVGQFIKSAEKRIELYKQLIWEVQTKKIEI